MKNAREMTEAEYAEARRAIIREEKPAETPAAAPDKQVSVKQMDAETYAQAKRAALK